MCKMRAFGIRAAREVRVSIFPRRKLHSPTGAQIPSSTSAQLHIASLSIRDARYSHLA